MTRLQHWLFTLRAVLSDDDAKLASRGGQPFPGGIPVYPLSSCREFWVFRDPPLSLGLSWRDRPPDPVRHSGALLIPKRSDGVMEYWAFQRSITPILQHPGSGIFHWTGISDPLAQRKGARRGLISISS